MSRRYPRDEFDAVVPGEGRRGAHRARPHRLLPVVPAAVVAGVTGVLALSAVALLGGGGDGAATDPGAPAVVAVQDEPAAALEAVPADLPADPSGSADGEVVEAAVVPEPPAEDAEPEADAEPEQDAEPEEDAEPDTSVPLVVLNGTKTTGLAARASALLQREGWTVSSTGNERSGAVRATTVAYADADLAVTAEAVAADLGGEAVLDPDAGAGALTVVLGPGWTP